MLALDFLVPSRPECIDLVKVFALGLRGYGGDAGQHWEISSYPNASRLHGISNLRVTVPKDEAVYQAALWTLTAVDLWCLKAAWSRRLRVGQPYRPLYEEICYEREPDGQEQWLSTEALYQLGKGDCEDLACARAAERLAIGDFCSPAMLPQPTPTGGLLYHIVIVNPDGSIEDPSALLGMPTGDSYADSRADRRCRRPLPGPGGT